MFLKKKIIFKYNSIATPRELLCVRRKEINLPNKIKTKNTEKNFTTSETHTYTDADGNTVTTTTTNNNGEVTTETTSTK